jgi:hypothetical protein
VKTLPPAAAAQNSAEAHDTGYSIELVAMVIGVDHESPLNVTAAPMPTTAQNVESGQDMES